MNVKDDFYSEVSRKYNEVSSKVDTEKTQINAAETKRVLLEAFKVLAGMPTAEAFDIISKSISYAASASYAAKKLS
ncbi:MAG: hypothetical protein DWI02_03810 [Planctomycetota bacterium]|nr:MAG: hypothetical protein DWI02_03810 [Planctomycetota bacterium]